MSGITIPTLDEITGHTVMAKLRSLCKRFIGLAEEVDEKIDAPLEEAHLAVETANATLATAQESLEDAQDAVTTANSASQTATEASESAQESAETVAGYDTRLTAVENGKLNITDVNDYAVGLTGNQNPIAGVKTFTDISYTPHMSKASNTYYRWFNIPKVDGSYYLTASIATRTASFIQVYTITVSNGSVSTVTKINMCNAGVNTSIKVGAFTDTDKIYICVHLDASNQYVCPVLLGFHGNYGDVVTITHINQFNSTVGVDYTEVTV